MYAHNKNSTYKMLFLKTIVFEFIYLKVNGRVVKKNLSTFRVVTHIHVLTSLLLSLTITRIDTI